MIKSFQSQYNHFRLIIFQLKRVNFLNDPNKKKKSEKKTEADPKPIYLEKKFSLIKLGLYYQKKKRTS
jgi:hypothetical protein